MNMKNKIKRIAAVLLMVTLVLNNTSAQAYADGLLSIFGVFGTEKLETTVLTASGETYEISVSYDQEAQIPEGAELKAVEILEGTPEYEAYVAEAKAKVAPEGEEAGETKDVTYARFFDITILYNGEEIQPAKPVQVEIKLQDEKEEEKAEDITFNALHFTEDGAESVDAEFGESVTFEAEGFSVWGIVGTETITVPFVAGDGSTYEVTVNFDKEAGIPENSKLIVTEVSETSSRYEGYVAQAAEAIDARTIDLQYVKLLDISIVDETGNEVKLDAPVDVQIKLLDKEQAEETTQVVHFEGTDETPVVMESNVDADTVNFSTDGFSIYAIVDSGDTSGDARMTLEFYNGTTLIDKMYVKNSDVLLGDGEPDPNKQYIENIIYDPGAGVVQSGKIFKGWIKDKENYTVADADNALDIKDIRQWAADHPITENETVKFYALIYTSFKVDYRDEDNISLGTDNILLPANDDNPSSSYTVQHAYTPKDDLHNFEGWKVQEGGDNISGHTEGRIYENGTEITISGDVTFSVNAAEGHWLVFHEDGGTYIAPQFIKSEENTVRPTTAMQKDGYTFDDWYTDDTYTTKFNFGTPITKRTHAYAHWTVNQTAPYTIIIWTQNLDGEKWDYVDSFQLEGNTNTIINTVSQQGTGQNAYARINGRNYQYTGFHLDHFDQNETIKPDGTAVVNVYYTRNSYTFTFQANARGRFDYSYDMDVYLASTPRTNIYTVTRLYDQDISDIWEFTGSNGVHYPETNANTSWYPQGSSTYTARITSMQRMPAENITFILTHTDRTTRYFHYYIETVDGATGSRQFSGRQYDLYKDLPNDFNIVYYNDDFWNLNGFTRQAITKSGNQVVNLNAGDNISWYNLNRYYGGTDNHLYFYYTRNKYPITYMDGAYFNGRGALMEDIPNRGHLSDSEDIYYDASLTAYGSGGSKEYVPTYPNFVFQGWYLDKACTQPYPFETSNMPEGGITVYAKWTQVEYRVFLHPNAGTDASLDWGSDDQEMNFRVANGGTISVPQGLRTGYEMVGWFTNEACTAPFDESFVLNETTVTAAYDKTVDMTDTMDKWGNGATTNADVDRNWITKKFDLYAKWRKVIDGALGIGVVYDANGGSNPPTDTTLYLDTAEATAQTASTPPEGKKFEYWVIQSWDTEQGKYVDTEDKIYPGDTYIVLLDNAKQVISSWVNPNNPEDISPTQDATHTKIHEATYTVQLRAEYLDVEQETPTHIDWFANNGTGNMVSDSKDGTLKINEPVNIRPSNTFTYPGHKFLGWARVDDVEGGEHPDHPEFDEDDLWLIYDETTNTFKVNQGGTTGLRTVSQIAADERQPYHDLYAVWDTRTYKVTIKKMVEGIETESNFTIGYAFDDTSLEDGNITLQHSGSQELAVDVPYGTTITLTENVTGYDKSFSAVRTTKDDGTALDEPVAVSETITGSGAFVVEGNTTITVTNTRQKGNLEISKVTDPAGIAASKTYKVSVKNSANEYLQNTSTLAFGQTEQWFDISVNNKLTIQNLPTDTYTVAESEDNTAIEGYRYNGASYSADNGAIEVVSKETATLTVTNSYTKLANVTVTKILDDNYPAGSTSFSFTPVLTENDKDITSQYITDLTDGKFTLTPTGEDGTNKSASITLENLPVGAVLNITETADSKYTTTIKVNGTTAETGSLTVADTTNGNTIEFTNTRKTYVVDFKKTAVDGTGLNGAAFILKLFNGTTYVTYPEGSLTLGTDVRNLVPGSYELTETSSPSGYIILNNNVHFTVDDEGNVSDPTKDDDTTTDANFAVKQAGTSEGSKATIVIKNTPGEELPMTGGPGTSPYTLSGIVLMLGAALMYGFRMRRRERRLN